jgi:hypothetical protein
VVEIHAEYEGELIRGQATMDGERLVRYTLWDEHQQPVVDTHNTWVFDSEWVIDQQVQHHYSDGSIVHTAHLSRDLDPLSGDGGLILMSSNCTDQLEDAIIAATGAVGMVTLALGAAAAAGPLSPVVAFGTATATAASIGGAMVMVRRYRACRRDSAPRDPVEITSGTW